MRHIVVGVSATLVVIVAMITPAHALTRVIDARVDESGFAIDNDGVTTVRAWNSNYAVHVKIGNAAPTAITRLRLAASLGGIDLGGPHGDLISYAVKTHVSLDLRFYDVTLGHAVHIADAVNSRLDETDPTISGQWLLFDRGPRGLNQSRVVLYKLDGTDTRILAHVHIGFGPNSALADQVNGDWAVYQVCDQDTCSVHRYQISTQTDVKLPNANRAAYGATVTTAGDVYYAIGDRERCGRNTSIRHWTSGSAPAIARLHRASTSISSAAPRCGPTSGRQAASRSTSPGFACGRKNYTASTAFRAERHQRTSGRGGAAARAAAEVSRRRVWLGHGR